MIAVIDDDPSVREALQELLRSARYRARTFPSAEAFLAAMDPHDFACLVADVHLPGMSGVALVRELVKSGKSMPTLLITARDDARTRELVRTVGDVPHLNKPFSDAAFFEVVGRLCSR
jgi:FixJ family two-component response regulator